MSAGSRLIWVSEDAPCSTKPSGPFTSSEISIFLTSSSVKLASKKRTNGPMAQDALLSLALDSSSAERPSKSRRLTSLPSVAPTMRPSLVTTSTTSGSGLFQVDFGCRPASTQVPTADSTGALVNTSASGPMPTSRYWLQAFWATSTSLTCCASAEPGFNCDRSVPTIRVTSARIACRRIRIAARPLLDHPLQHRHGEGDAGRLDHLQIDRRQQPRLGRIAGVGRRVVQHILQRARPARPSRRATPRPDRQRGKLAGGGKLVGDVEHAVLADRDHRRAGEIGTPDPPHQRGVGEIVGQNEGGVCGDRHRGDPREVRLAVRQPGP